MYWVPASSSKNSTARAGQPGDVGGQLLEHRRGALAASVGDGVGDFVARRADFGWTLQRPVADQVPDVGQRPRLRGLGEQVVAELIQALFKHVDLGGDELHRL